MEDADRALALALQAEYEEVANLRSDDSESCKKAINKADITLQLPDGRRPKSIVDAVWEMLDPNPDVRALFQQFNAMFFWGKLSMVEVKWSPRMTLCAGLCCYEGRGGLCSIRLSEPLLRLRPRKDVVETLLHEMIHALLFVTSNNKDHDAHGPQFCEHMKRINAASGSNITIYHSFHDEVAEMRQHWWRCQGPCQNKPPYWGIVKRAMNRAPSPNDFWWAEHQRKCGGTYKKIKEPENYGKKKTGKKATTANSPVGIIPHLSQRAVSSGERTGSPKSDQLVCVKSTPGLPGSRLGGRILMKNNRGIPAGSSLLNRNAVSQKNCGIPANRQPNSPKTSLQDFDLGAEFLPKAVNASLCTEGSGKQSTLDDKWGALLATKRKSASNYTPPSRKKRSNAVSELVARMKRNGQRSVNAGAPAFTNTPPVVNFSRAVLLFKDGEDETCALASKENRLMRDYSSQKLTTPNGQEKLSPAVKSQNSSLMRRPMNAEIFSESSVALASDPATLSTDELLPEVYLSTKRNASDKDVDHNANPNIANLRKRLSSFSDEDETLTKTWKKGFNTKFPASKKTKSGDVEHSPTSEGNNVPGFSSSKPSLKTEQNSSDSLGLGREAPTVNVVEEVCCPICNVEFSLAAINSHIDDCLSLKAIRDSSFD